MIKSQPGAQPYFSIGDQETEMITNIRCLRVQMDSQLNREKHILILIYDIDTIKVIANRALGLNRYSKKNVYLLIYSITCTEGLLSPI